MTVAGDAEFEEGGPDLSSEPLVASPGSARNWIIGEGHVPLGEARRRAVEGVEEAEAKLEEAQAAQTAAWKALTAAKGEHDRAYEKRQAARARLRRAQDEVLRRCSLPPEDS